MVLDDIQDNLVTCRSRRTVGVLRLGFLATVAELGDPEGTLKLSWELDESEVFGVDGSCTSHSGT